MNYSKMKYIKLFEEVENQFSNKTYLTIEELLKDIKYLSDILFFESMKDKSFTGNPIIHLTSLLNNRVVTLHPYIEDTVHRNIPKTYVKTVTNDHNSIFNMSDLFGVIICEFEYSNNDIICDKLLHKTPSLFEWFDDNDYLSDEIKMKYQHLKNELF